MPTSFAHHGQKRSDPTQLARLPGSSQRALSLSFRSSANLQPVRGHPRWISQRQHEGDEILLFLSAQLCAKNQVEELDCIVQSHEPSVMEVSRSILHPPQDWSLDRSIASRGSNQAVNDLGLVEALHVQVMHQIVGVVGCLVARTTLPFAKKDLLTAQLLRCGFVGVELSKYIEFGRGRKIQDLLKFGHVVDLASSFQNVYTLLSCDYRVAIEVGGALLKFCEILHALQGSLRAEKTLNVHPAKRRRVDAVTHLLRANVAGLVRGSIGTAVLMTIQAGHPKAWMLRAAVRCLIELLLREWSQQ